MFAILSKEINTFFSSLIGYMVIGVYLVIMGLFLWVFPDTNLLDGGYASLQQFFVVTPSIFLFLIPAITMRMFAEENQTGTIELLATRPLRDIEIVMGKYLAALGLVIFALIPTLLYYLTIHQLGSPVGNLDSGAILGSYIGLILIGACFVAVGIFCSALTSNQIVAFIFGAIICYIFFDGIGQLSRLKVFFGNELIVQQVGLSEHYYSISRGILDTRDILYFISFITFFIGSTLLIFLSRKW